MILKHEISPMPANTEKHQNVHQLLQDRVRGIAHLTEEESIKLFMKYR